MAAVVSTRVAARTSMCMTMLRALMTGCLHPCLERLAARGVLLQVSRGQHRHPPSSGTIQTNHRALNRLVRRDEALTGAATVRGKDERRSKLKATTKPRWRTIIFARLNSSRERRWVLEMYRFYTRKSWVRRQQCGIIGICGARILVASCVLPLEQQRQDSCTSAGWF